MCKMNTVRNRKGNSGTVLILLLKKYINLDTHHLLGSIWIKNIKVNKKREEKRNFNN